MKPCPKCGCKSHKLAFAIYPAVSTVAIACMACEHIGPECRMTFPPDRQTCDRAADLWDAEIVRQSLPARLARRLPARYVEPDYVKPAHDGTMH